MSDTDDTAKLKVIITKKINIYLKKFMIRDLIKNKII